MLNTTERPAAADSAAADKKAAKAETAAIVKGITSLLNPDEQLLGYARASIAGGIKGKLTIGPEAMVAPLVNIGLTDKRLILQHVNSESKQLSRIAPHSFPLTEIRTIEFSDLAIHGHQDTARLIITLVDEQHIRLRSTGKPNFGALLALTSVYNALTGSSRHGGGASLKCSACEHVLDTTCRFCPFCGAEQSTSVTAEKSEAATEPVDHATEAEPIAAEAEQEPEFAVAFAGVPQHGADGDAEPLPSIMDTELSPATPEETSPPTVDSPEQFAVHIETDVPVPTVLEDWLPPMADNPADLAQPSVHEHPAIQPSELETAPPAEAISDADAEISFEPVGLSTAPDPTYAFQPGPELPVPDAAETDLPPAQSEPPGEMIWDIPSPAPVLSEMATPAPHAESAPETAGSNVEASEEVAAELTAPSTIEAVSVEQAATPEPPRIAVGIVVHFHVNHPVVQFNESLRGTTAEEIVALLKSHAANNLRFPLKLAVMRMTPYEFCREVIQRYNYTEGKSLPIPANCDEFLATSQLIGFAHIEPYDAD